MHFGRNVQQGFEDAGFPYLDMVMTEFLFVESRICGKTLGL